MEPEEGWGTKVGKGQRPRVGKIFWRGSEGVSGNDCRCDEKLLGANPGLNKRAREAEQGTIDGNKQHVG